MASALLDFALCVVLCCSVLCVFFLYLVLLLFCIDLFRFDRIVPALFYFVFIRLSLHCVALLCLEPSCLFVCMCVD